MIFFMKRFFGTRIKNIKYKIQPLKTNAKDNITRRPNWAGLGRKITSANLTRSKNWLSDCWTPLTIPLSDSTTVSRNIWVMARSAIHNPGIQREVFLTHYHKIVSQNRVTKSKLKLDALTENETQTADNRDVKWAI